MNALIIYFIGWLIFSIGYVIYNKIIDKSDDSYKLIIYKGLKYGVCSWFGIIAIFTVIIIAIMFELDGYIEEKLKK